MNLRPLALALALAVTTLGSAIPQTADACGDYQTPEVGVQRALSRHFSALGAHDRGALLAAWRPGSTVVSGGAPVLVEPVERAASRWLTAKGPVSFHVTEVQASEDAAVAYVDVVFDGRRVVDTVLLAPTDAGQWQITGKSSRPVDAEARGAAPVRAALRY